MAQIEPIVKVDITLQTSTETRQGFGTALFATVDRRFPELIRTYSSVTAVAEDFATTDQAYLAAAKHFSQTPRPTRIKIGQVATDVTLAAEPATASGEIYTFVFIDNANQETIVTYTSSGVEGADVVVTGLITAMEAAGLTNNVDPLDDKVSVTNNGTSFTMATANSLGFATSNTRQTTNLTRSVAADGTQTAADMVNTFASEDGDWYFFASDMKSTDSITGFAAAIEPLMKMYAYTSNSQAILTAYDPNAISVEDPMGLIDASNYERTFGAFHDDDSEYVEMAWLGYNAPYDAGSVSWGNAELAGVDAPLDPATGKALSETQRQWIADRNGNVQVPRGNRLLMRLGVTGSGEAISTIRGRDSMNDDITNSFVRILTNTKGTRLVFDDDDINTFGAALKTVLDSYVERKFILEGYTITLPRAVDIPAADKATGNLKGITFAADLAAAILSAEVQGSISI